MTVRTPVQPSFTAQDAASYKGNIDATIAVNSEIGGLFAPHEQAVLALGITMEAGSFMDGTSIAATSLSGIGLPTTGPRIDRIYLDLNSRLYVRIVGTEAVSPAAPVAPAYPFGKFPIAQVLLNPTDTVITNDAIIDERTMVTAPAAFFNGDGYLTIVDPDGLVRFLVGKTANDPRIIVRFHLNNGTSKIEGQQSDGAVKWNIYDNGIMQPGVFATVAALPAASVALRGSRAMVLDGSVVALGNFGTVVAGAGTNAVTVYCDGAAWRIG